MIGLKTLYPALTKKDLGNSKIVSEEGMLNPYKTQCNGVSQCPSELPARCIASQSFVKFIGAKILKLELPSTSIRLQRNKDIPAVMASVLRKCC
jgi:hypothetical protein